MHTLFSQTVCLCGSAQPGLPETTLLLEEARRPVRDEAAALKLVAALEKAGDDEEAQVRAQRRHDCCVRCRPHIRDLRVCSECGIVSNRDRNGAANIGLNCKRFALGIGAFKVPDKRQATLIAAQAQDHE